MNKQDCWFFILGLLDSDGCLYYSWDKRSGFLPEAIITQKVNGDILVWAKEKFLGYYSEKTGNWKLFKSSFSEQKPNLSNFEESFNNTAEPPFFFENGKDPSTCYLITDKRIDAIFFWIVARNVEREKTRTVGQMRPADFSLLYAFFLFFFYL